MAQAAHRSFGNLLGCGLDLVPHLVLPRRFLLIGIAVDPRSSYRGRPQARQLVQAEEALAMSRPSCREDPRLRILPARNHRSEAASESQVPLLIVRLGLEQLCDGLHKGPCPTASFLQLRHIGFDIPASPPFHSPRDFKFNRSRRVEK